MAKGSVLTINNIAAKGLESLSDYDVSTDHQDPQAIILRSQKLHDYDFGSSLLAVGRAGAGVNNIPVDRLSDAGVVVFNAPGANANAVKELVLSGMLISARNLFAAYDFVKDMSGSEDELNQSAEANKKQFAGTELAGKTLGIIGLGAIGVKVANTAIDLGMHVIGYDPAMTVQNAWKLSAQVERAEELEYVFSSSDFVSFHVPLIEQTRNLFSKDLVACLKPGITIMNFSRAGIVDHEAILEGIKAEKIKAFCTDFPHPAYLGNSRVMVMPHLGASTKEAEENCSIMVCNQVKEYIETGNLTNSVNFPNVFMRIRPDAERLVIINRNVPNMLAEISGKLGAAGINIVDMINKSRGDYAYTIVDASNNISDAILEDLKTVEGIIKVRKIA